MLCLFIVQLIVAGVSAAGSCCDHGSGLGVGHACCCVVPGTCYDEEIKQEWLLCASVFVPLSPGYRLRKKVS